ncbi:glycine-rich RNA-binding protein 10 [Anopheles merus]|uniref:RRM domain-containing protein n=1 Tax=Anopheles merus TaxID=30066 RepID=A0A182USX0_ANOME|nr:glycine-rich RNA-binding protein 10 [Anopheles merus]
MIPRTKVFVGSLPPATKPEEVRRLFENYGVVTECDVMNRCAFVHMQNQDMAESAIQALHNTTFKGVTIVVERGRVRERPPGGVGGGSMDSARGRPGAGPMRGSRGGMRSQPYGVGAGYGAARTPGGYGARANYGTGGGRYEGGYRNDSGYSSSSNAYGYGYSSNGGGYGSTRHSSSEDRRGFTLPSYPSDPSRGTYGSNYDGYSSYDGGYSSYGYDTTQGSSSYQRWPSSAPATADSYSYAGGYSQASADPAAAVGQTTDYSQSYPSMSSSSSGYRSASGYGQPASGRRF